MMFRGVYVKQIALMKNIHQLMKHSDQNALLDNYLKKTKVSLVRFISEFHHLLGPT